MAWQTILVPMTRQLIGDFTTTTYDDTYIQNTIVIAGLLTSQDYTFENVYSFDLETPDMSPDPTSQPSPDAAAIALFTLKAACLLNTANFQNSVKAGIHVRDGTSEVDTTKGFKGYADVLKLGPCGAYNSLLQSLLVRKIATTGRCIASPVNIRGFYGEGGEWSVSHFFNILF